VEDAVSVLVEKEDAELVLVPLLVLEEIGLDVKRGVFSIVVDGCIEFV